MTLREAPSGESGEDNRRLMRNADGGAKRMGRDSPQQESSWNAWWKIYAHVKMSTNCIARARFWHPSTPRQFTGHHSYLDAIRMTTRIHSMSQQSQRWLVLHIFWKKGQERGRCSSTCYLRPKHAEWTVTLGAKWAFPIPKLRQVVVK